MTEDYAIITENLSKIYNKIIAVKKLNLKIPYGKIYSLLGPNGAGKTTTIRMLNTIIEPTRGTAKVGGYDISSQRKNVKMISGLLPESPSLYLKLTALEFLEFIGELYYMKKEEIFSRIDELLKLFSLENRKDDLLEGYSRGMKQKVCLCAALIHDPKIIFLDEPTSNLDPASARIVKDLIIQYAKKYEKTIFLCTHMLDVAEELSDIIGIINNGTIEIEGSSQDILNTMKTSSLEEAYLKTIGLMKTDGSPIKKKD